MRAIYKPVLVVEDDTDIRDTLQLILEEDLYPVLLARNGQEALDRLAESSRPPGLILLDIQMPIMDGRSFLRKIRSDESDPRWRQLPVVVLTAAGGMEKLDPEPDGFLAKPVAIDRLMEVIEKYCKEKTEI